MLQLLEYLINYFYRFLLMIAVIAGVLGKLIYSNRISDEEIEKIRKEYFEKKDHSD